MLADFTLRYGYALVFVAAAVEGDGTLLAATFLAIAATCSSVS